MVKKKNISETKKRIRRKNGVMGECPAPCKGENPMPKWGRGRETSGRK